MRSTGSEICFLNERYRFRSSAHAPSSRNAITHLDGVHHLLRLVLPELVRDAPDLLPQQPELFLPVPRRVLLRDDRLLRALDEPRLAPPARLAHDVREAVPLDAHAVQDLLLERDEARLVQVLQLPDKERRERRVERRDEVRALALVDTLVVPRRVAVVPRCARKKNTFSVCSSGRGARTYIGLGCARCASFRPGLE